MAYVYEHWRPDTDSCFYVGKGTKNRRTEFRRPKNKHYSNIINKLDSLGLNVDVRIVKDGLSDEEAFSLEVKRIEFWKEHGVILTNISVGGRGGMSGCIRSERSREKQSATTSGRKLGKDHAAKVRARLQSPEWIDFIRKIHTGSKRSKETAERIREGVKRSWSDPEKKRTRLANRPKITFSEHSRANMRAAKTPEVRAKLSAATKKQWENPEYRKIVSDTMKRTNARKAARCAE